MTFPALTDSEERTRNESIQSALRSKSAYHYEAFWCDITYLSDCGGFASVVVSQPGFHVADLALTDDGWAVLPGSGSLHERFWQQAADCVHRSQQPPSAKFEAYLTEARERNRGRYGRSA